MVLSIWYSYNHKCFKTRIGWLPWGAEIGYMNGFGEELLAVYPLQEKRTLKSLIKRFKPRKKSRQVVYITKYKRRWWR